MKFGGEMAAGADGYGDIDNSVERGDIDRLRRREGVTEAG